MPNKINLIVYPVANLEDAKTFYSSLLGTGPYADTPYYVGYRVGDLEIGLDPRSTVGPIAYADVDDISSSLKEMTAAGAVVVQDVKDVAKGLLTAQVKDGSGNVVGLKQQP
jgi:predicted enzyme related to lactoylglutathione lyase